MKRSPTSYTTTPKKDKISQKKTELWYVHIVELSTGVVKVDIKVINPSWTQHQCLQCVVPPLMHDEIYRDCATSLNWTMMAWSSSSTSIIKQNQIYQFFPKSLNQRWLQFLFAYSFSNWLVVLGFFWFWKAVVKCPSFSVNSSLMTSDMA